VYSVFDLGVKSDQVANELSSGFAVEINPITWYFVFLLIMFSGYAITRIYLGNVLINTFYAAIRYNRALKIINDNSQFQKQVDQVLLGFYFLSIGFFLMILMERINFHPFGLIGFKLFVFNVLLLMILLFSRSIILLIIGVIFNQSKLFNEYLNHGFFYHQLAGIVLLPMNFLLIYTTGIFNEIIVIVTLLTFAIIYFVRILRGVVFATKHGILNIYLFLYLCALEIVPLLLLYKYICSVSYSL